MRGEGSEMTQTYGMAYHKNRSKQPDYFNFSQCLVMFSSVRAPVEEGARLNWFITVLT